jgi:hypothetical protein
MKSSDNTLVLNAVPLERRRFWEAFRLWLMDADKTQLGRVFKVALLLLAGYAPFAALNDALAPFTFGLPFLDDLDIPLGILAAIKIYFEIRKYQSPHYVPKRKR